MDITPDQMQIITNMLGTPSIKWSRCGFYFASQKNEKLSQLVDLGIITVNKSIESWGPCFTYSVNHGDIRDKIAILMLQEEIGERK